MTARRIALVALIAAVLGVYIGRVMLPQPMHTGAELHALLHDRLDLDAAQEATLNAIEKDFASKRRTLDAQLRADNALLALRGRSRRGDAKMPTHACRRKRRRRPRRA